MIPTLILLGPILSLNSVWFAPQEPPAAVQPAPRLGIELAAQAPGANLSMAELEDLLLRRIALSQNGRGALRQLIDLAVLDYLAHERGVTISTAQLGERWAQIEREVIQAGQATSMEAFLEESGVDRPTFRRYLELALIQEVLTRKALGMDPKAEVTAEQQKLWIDSEIQALGYKELPYFWEGGVVAEIGPIRILRSDYARHLREQTDPKELRQACYDALLLKKIRQRMPDLSDEAEARAIDAEMAQRRKDMEQDVRYQGIKYEEILATQGLNLDILRRDPAVIIAALAHVWVDRTCDDDCLRGVYQSEREQFDGRFGEGAETYAIRLTAGQVTNDLVPRTYSEAEAALEALRPDLGDLKAFQRLAAVQTEDIRARESGGLVGYVRTRTPGVDPAIRNAVKAALDAHPGPVQGLLVGPIRLQGSVVLLCLGER
ncbi:MAG TPA: hypothetical protein PLJ12_15905, partial [Planctomycetota bacterium]|nr:hypothetical protein [Planctomycetota bacterium]